MNSHNWQRQVRLTIRSTLGKFASTIFRPDILAGSCQVGLRVGRGIWRWRCCLRSGWRLRCPSSRNPEPTRRLTTRRTVIKIRYRSPIPISRINTPAAKSIQGVPNSVYSFVVTSGEQAGNGYGFIRSTVGLPAVVPPAAPIPARPMNLTLPAGTVNGSLGGMMDAFRRGLNNTVMNQCYAGGFAFNLQGSLQGVVPPWAVR